MQYISSAIHYGKRVCSLRVDKSYCLYYRRIKSNKSNVKLARQLKRESILLNLMTLQLQKIIIAMFRSTVDSCSITYLINRDLNLFAIKNRQSNKNRPRYAIAYRLKKKGTLEFSLTAYEWATSDSRHACKSFTILSRKRNGFTPVSRRPTDVRVSEKRGNLHSCLALRLRLQIALYQFLPDDKKDPNKDYKLFILKDI